jgi:hypothetical protein
MSIFNNKHVSFFLVITATITLVSAQHLRGLSSSSWTPATWEYNGDKHTDPAWNLCNGLGKKCDMVSGVAGIPNCNEEGNIPKGALELPCDACRKACTLNGAHGGLSNWNGNCDIPSKETIEAAEKAWTVGGTYPFIKDGPEDTGTIAAYCEDKTTADRKLGVLQAMQYVCIPDPDAISENQKITATIGIGHALGECGSLWLFKKDDSSSSNDDIIAQLQVDTRSWSFESSAINTLWPNENSKGCDVPLSQPVKWDCPANANGACELPIGWTEGACASSD